jgi:inosine triphosphate pyrophosphatase
MKTLIIGAGPAGITFANTLSTVYGDNNFILVDMGKPVRLRKHDSEADIACGEGGNGLFSDGKFSFFPAGTNVWKLCYHLLTMSYNQMNSYLSQYTTVPNMPTEDEIRNYLFHLENHWTLKKYPTTYISLEERKKLIQSITNDIPKECLLFQHKVISCTFIPELKIYKVIVQSMIDDYIHGYEVERIVFTGGRFFPLSINKLFTNVKIPTVFRRYEFGVRLETSADNQAMIGVGEIRNILDPKLRRMDSEYVEFRTFCWCRNGETVLSEFNGMRTYSGRSDCEPTNRSNFGFLVRITDPELISNEDFQKIAHTQNFDISLIDAISTDLIINIYGDKIGKLMKKALISITDEYPQLISSESKILGPSIEGVGVYPDITHNLCVRGGEDEALSRIYCLGDNTGIFRGIIPCMISGHYLANSWNHPLTRNITFVTGNENKVKETEKIIGPLTVCDIDLPEYQGTPENIAKQKCILASQRVKGPVIVEDTSLCFDALGGMPGPYVKWFLKNLGIHGMVKMLDSFPDKTAYAKCVFAYSKGPEHEPEIFVGITKGQIVNARGSTHFGWDPIFQPDGYSLTYAELDNGIKDKISHRHKAIRLLEQYLYNNV